MELNNYYVDDNINILKKMESDKIQLKDLDTRNIPRTCFEIQK